MSSAGYRVKSYGRFLDIKCNDYKFNAAKYNLIVQLFGF